jgi:hypothetical protein
VVAQTARRRLVQVDVHSVTVAERENE